MNRLHWGSSSPLQTLTPPPTPLSSIIRHGWRGLAQSPEFPVHGETVHSSPNGNRGAFPPGKGYTKDSLVKTQRAGPSWGRGHSCCRDPHSRRSKDCGGLQPGEAPQSRAGGNYGGKLHNSFGCTPTELRFLNTPLLQSSFLLVAAQLQLPPNFWLEAAISWVEFVVTVFEDAAWNS